MDNYSVGSRGDPPERRVEGPNLVPVEVVWVPPVTAHVLPRVRRRRVALPLVLFVLTCASTFLTGIWETGGEELNDATGAALRDDGPGAVAHLLTAVRQGVVYAGCLMTILICHEAGHFLQARRYRVYASFPYFIPMIPPIGTMGAVIAMEAHTGDRKALFDIGITGPLAGLVPTLIFSIVGLNLSRPMSTAPVVAMPPIFRMIAETFFPQLAEAHGIDLHAMAYAGWVGLLITSLNLFPIGQLDGGHVLYGLLRTKAHAAATTVLLGVTAAVFLGAALLGNPRLMGWTPMLLLLYLMGARHPPTANDNVPLGFWRHVLGWLTLAFLPLGFTPIPFLM